MDNKLDINVTEKKVSDENLLKTVEEALMKNELCLFMSETGTFMTTGTTDDAEEIFLKIAKCFACRLFGHGKSNRL